MSCNTKDPLLLETYNEIRDDSNPTNWLVAGYKDTRDVIQFYEKGSGDFQEMRDYILNLGEVVYAYVRLGDKFAVITFISDKATGVKRARALVHGRSVNQLFKQNNLTITISNQAELEESHVRNKLRLDLDASLPSSPVGDSTPSSPIQERAPAPVDSFPEKTGNDAKASAESVANSEPDNIGEEAQESAQSSNSSLNDETPAVPIIRQESVKSDDDDDEKSEADKNEDLTAASPVAHDVIDDYHSGAASSKLDESDHDNSLLSSKRSDALSARVDKVSNDSLAGSYTSRSRSNLDRSYGSEGKSYLSTRYGIDKSETSYTRTSPAFESITSPKRNDYSSDYASRANRYEPSPKFSGESYLPKVSPASKDKDHSAGLSFTRTRGGRDESEAVIKGFITELVPESQIWKRRLYGIGNNELVLFSTNGSTPVPVKRLNLKRITGNVSCQAEILIENSFKLQLDKDNYHYFFTDDQSNHTKFLNNIGQKA